MAKMAGRMHPDWCPYCHAPPGPDCPSRGKSNRSVRRELQRELCKEIDHAQEDSVSDDC